MVPTRRHARHWGNIVAAGIAAFAFTLGHIEGVRARAEPAHSAAAQSPRSRSDPSRTPPLNGATERMASALEAQVRYEQSPQGQKDAHDAAKAAQQAAKWARWLFIDGVAETLVTVAGVVLVGLTLLQAKRTADETAKSAKAAIDAVKEAQASNEITADASERQSRAYLAVQPGGINLTTKGRAVGDVVITNVGQTPANCVHAIVKIRLEKDRESRNFRNTTKWKRAERTIHPRDSMRRSSTGDLDADEIYKSDAYVFVFGVVYYSDGFNVPRFTRFCHRYPSARVIFEDRPLMHGRPDLGMGQVFAQTMISPMDARHHQYGNDAD